MSVTFATELPGPPGTDDSPCLCAQMTTGFASMMRGHDTPEVRASLATGADPACPSCGSGVERVPRGDPLRLNLANDNALRLLALLGLPMAPAGECTIAEARRALLRARNVDLGNYVREDEVVHGAARERADGAVELRPVRAWIGRAERRSIGRLCRSFGRARAGRGRCRGHEDRVVLTRY
jgi:hypothetical protein